MDSGNSNFISSISSLIVAGSALFLTVWQTHSARENNKLSVRPNVEVISGFSLHDKEAYLRLTNTGLGPAAIKHIEVFMQGKKFDSKNLSPAQAITKAIGMNDHLHCFDIDPVAKSGVTLPAGQHLNLIYFGKAFSNRRFKRNCTSNNEAIEYKSKNLKLIVHYESSYQEKFKTIFEKKSTYFSDEKNSNNQE